MAHLHGWLGSMPVVFLTKPVHFLLLSAKSLSANFFTTKKQTTKNICTWWTSQEGQHTSYNLRLGFYLLLTCLAFWHPGSLLLGFSRIQWIILSCTNLIWITLDMANSLFTVKFWKFDLHQNGEFTCHNILSCFSCSVTGRHSLTQVHVSLAFCTVKTASAQQGTVTADQGY